MENSKFILENTKHWTANCDSKVSYLLTVNGVILTIIFTSENSKYLVQTLNYSIADNLNFQAIINFLELLFLVGFLTLIITSLYYAFSSLKGRIDPNEFSDAIDLNDSKIFWGTISQKTPADFFSQIDNVSESDFKKDLRNQIYITSKICSLKFKFYNKMLQFTSIAYIFLILYAVLKIKNIS